MKVPTHKGKNLQHVYFDWNKTQINVLFDDAEDDIVLKDLDSLMDMLTEPSVIIGEATFESFQLEKRRNVIARAMREGHTLLTTPNRATGRWRKAMYPEYNNKPLPDNLAVKVIRHIASQTDTHLKIPAFPDSSWVTVREAANSKLMRLRSEFRWAYGPRGGRKVVSAKDDYADDLIQLLPEYVTLTAKQKLALGDGKEYNKTVVAAVGVTAEYVDNIKDFDRLSGMYHHGYPSQIRSDLHHWRWRFLKGQVDLTLSQYRREIRWLFHQIRSVQA